MHPILYAKAQEYFVFDNRHETKIRLYKPKSASILQGFVSWLTGMPPEFSDSKFPSYSDGREVVRVSSGGHVSLKINVLTKDMEVFGYQVQLSRRMLPVMPYFQ